MQAVRKNDRYIAIGYPRGPRPMLPRTIYCIGTNFAAQSFTAASSPAADVFACPLSTTRLPLNASVVLRPVTVMWQCNDKA
jgi:hypothetical protein